MCDKNEFDHQQMGVLCPRERERERQRDRKKRERKRFERLEIFLLYYAEFTF